MGALTPSLAGEIARMIPLLASPILAERDATLGGIRRKLEGHGADFFVLAEHIAAPTIPVPFYSYSARRSTPSKGPAVAMRHLGMIRQCRARAASLSAWEREFVSDIESRVAGGSAPTERQREKLSQIARRLGIGGAK